MPENMKVIVDVPQAADKRHKAWRKHLQKIDPSQAGGYAYEGPWLPMGQKVELPLGSLVLAYDQTGSMKNWSPLVRVWRVVLEQGQPALQEVERWMGKQGQRDWALVLRSRITHLHLDSPGVPAPSYPPSAPDPQEGKMEEVLDMMERLLGWVWDEYGPGHCECDPSVDHICTPCCALDLLAKMGRTEVLEMEQGQEQQEQKQEVWP
jgi:hypothetical protein